MAKLTITQAARAIPFSESKLRRDMKAGEVSFEVDEKGKKFFDTSELRRLYGELTLPAENGQVNDTSEKLSETGHDSPKIVDLLENQITDLKAQLALSHQRETVLIDERSKLLDLLSAEKEEKRALMPPVDEKNQKSPNWVLRLLGAR